MPFYQVPQQATIDAYIALARKYNDPLTFAVDRSDLYLKSTGMLDAIRTEYGTVTTGMVICAADNAMMAEFGDRPMIGGFLVEPEKRAVVREECGA